MVVAFQGILGAQTLPANVTFEWPFSGMDSTVVFQLPLVR